MNSFQRLRHEGLGTRSELFPNDAVPERFKEGVTAKITFSETQKKVDNCFFLLLFFCTFHNVD